jgi:7-cyano-7-deazaguanine synthase
MRSVVLLSGGIDSSVALGCAIQDSSIAGNKNVGAISFHYGQKHKDMEIAAATKIANHFGIPHHIIFLDTSVFRGHGSALMDEQKMPELTYEEIAKASGPSPTYVPFRNGVLISQAVAFALSQGASHVYYGAHAEDARNFAYPDCTPEFNGALSAAVYVGTYHQVRLVTPLQNLSKAGVVALGSKLGIPFSLTYSCYQGRDLHCGTCPTCLGRKAAFDSNYIIDPTEYEA